MIRPDLAERERRRSDPPSRRRSFSRFTVAGCARGRRQRATALLERRSLALSPPLDRDDRSPRDLCVHPRFNQPSAWAVKSAGLAIVSSRLIGDDGARPEVGWVRLADLLLHWIRDLSRVPGRDGAGAIPQRPPRRVLLSDVDERALGF